MPCPQGTKFIITYHVNAPETNVQPLWTSLPAGLKFATGQLEIAPTTGAYHWQLFVITSKKCSISKLKSMLVMPSMHVEIARGSPDQCIKYCTKNESSAGARFSLGEYTAVKTTSASSSEELFHLVQAGQTIPQILEVYPKYCLMTKQLQNLQEVVRKPHIRKESPMVLWLYGASGTGKSKIAHKILDFLGDYYVHNYEDYYTDYDGYSPMLFDDIEPKALSNYIFLNLCDMYPFKLKRKFMNPLYVDPKLIIFTSNYEIDQVFVGNFVAFRRRVTHFMKF